MERAIESGFIKRILSFLLVGILLSGLLVPALASIEGSNTIIAFEQISPVYSNTVLQGTEKGELGLPETLKAVVKISSGSKTSTFKAAAPTDEQISEAGYKDNGNGLYIVPGNGDYRVYGELSGSEKTWFACDSKGNINGAVTDVKVDWEGSYEKDVEGVYALTASLSGYTYTSARPFA